MKKELKSIVLLFSFALSFVASGQNFTYQNTLSPSQLVQNVLIGNGITATNVTYNGSPVSAATPQPGALTYSATGTFPITPGLFPSDGVYLRTQGAPGIVDPDLAAIASGNPTNGSILEFDFQATGDTLNFEYVFASAEYLGFTCSSFNDAFGFFLSGPGIAGPYTNGAKNVALVPGTNVPVSINTVNSGVSSSGNPAACLAADPNFVANSVYFTTSYNNFSGQSYTGSTTALLAVSNLQCGGTYHIKLAICNVSDQSLNSGVYLKANSFVSNVVTIDAQGPIVGNFTDTLLAEGCVSTQLLFIRPSFYSDSAQTFNITYTGTATAADFVSLPTSVLFAVGVDTVVYTVNPIADGITEPMEWIEIKGYSVTVCGDTIYDSLTLYIVDHYDYSYTVPDTVTAVCVPDNPSVSLTNIVGSIAPFSTLWSFGPTTNTTNLPNNGFQPDTITYLVTVTDGCGWQVVDSVVLVVDSIPPAFNITPGLNATYTCVNNDLLFTAAVTSPTIGPYVFTWTDSLGNSTTGTTSTLLDNDLDNQTIQYDVSLLDGCGTVITQTVTLTTDYDVPDFTLSPTGPLYATCPTSLLPVALSLTPGTAPNYGPYQHSWTNGGTASTNLLGNNGVNGAQQWHVVTTVNFCGMTTKDSILVINQFTQPIAQILPNDTLIVDCIPDSALASAIVSNNTNGPYSYVWSNGSTNDSTIVYGGNTNNSSTPFSVTITDGCGFSSTANGVVIVNKTLKVDTTFSILSQACVPTGVAIGQISGATNVLGNTQYNWSGPGQNGVYSINASTASNISPGWYYFTATDDVCSVEDSVLVGVLNPPIALTSANPPIGNSPLNVTFNNSSQNTSTYFWDFGNGQTANTSDLSSVSSTYYDTGYYLVTLIATQGTNCNDTISVWVYVTEPPYIPPSFPPQWTIPNVFSPNDDKSNDLFYLETVNVETVQMKIMNRWGNVMFDKTGPNPAWDGKTKSGTDAEDGVYFYKIILTGIDGSRVDLDGFLHVVR